jgi:hypothetical protein
MFSKTLERMEEFYTQKGTDLVKNKIAVNLIKSGAVLEFVSKSA